ncbi:trichohyalin isoform X1 [Ictalurus furcatus]|uniref:trichohyalin isoform X1 n=1 Tax=Ictalurus furcatus TaxID=66913 RepID=UPI0023506E37|nr:trichohyalin isoform X1 [Ictalurus furcatus]
MEGSESAINRVGRAMWTVWGYLTGTVGRYLRPAVTNEEAHNVHFKREDTVTISKGYKELDIEEEEKERTEAKTSERKTREDLQYPGVSVRAAAVQWEKGKVAHDGHEVKNTSKHTYARSECLDKKSQTKKDIETTSDNKSESRTTHSKQFTEQEGSPAYVDADIKNRDGTFSGSEEAGLNVEVNEKHQEQRKKSEEEGEEGVDEIARRGYDETEEELIKTEFIEQSSLANEADLNVERDENNQAEGRKQEEEHVDEIMKRENDETEEEADKSEFVEQGLLTKDADLNVERSERSLEQIRKPEEEEIGADEIMRRENDETGEELIKNEFIKQGLLAKEADLNVEGNKNNQEERKNLEEEEEGADEIMWRENDETGEELIKNEFIEQGLLAKEDLNVEVKEKHQEQRKKSEEEEEEEEEGVDEIARRVYDETEAEPIKTEFIEQSSLAKEADLNVERNENNQAEGRKQEEEHVDEIMKRENNETEEEADKSEFIDQGLLTKEADLNVERRESSLEQIRKPEEEGVDEIMRRENDETEEELIKNEFIEQGLLSTDVDLNVEGNENNQELGRKSEEEEEEGVDEISRREYDETEEELIESEFIEQSSLAKEAGLNVEDSESSLEQIRKPEEEEEDVDEIARRVNNETNEEPIKSEFIEQGLLSANVDLNVEENENNQEQGRKSDEEEEEGVDEIPRRVYDETEAEPIKTEFIEQGLLAKEADLNVEVNEKHQEQRKKSEEEEEGVDEIPRRVYDETEDERIKSEFIEQGLLSTDVDLNVEGNENNQEQGRKSDEEEEEEEEGGDEISRREYDETEEELIESEFIEQSSLAKDADLNVEDSESIQEQIRKPEEEEEDVDEIARRVNNETNEEPIKSEFIEQGLLSANVDLNVEENENNQEQGRKSDEEEEEEGVDEIPRRVYDETEAELIKTEFIEQSSLAKEADLNVERNENNQEQRKKQEKEEVVVEIMRRENNETEEELIKSKFIEQSSLAKEADLNVEDSESSLEQIRKLEEEEEGVDKIMRENDETEEELIKRKFIEQDLLAKEADLNVERNENSQEQGRKQEEEHADEILRRENDETEEEADKIEFVDQGLLTKDADLNVERSENNQEQIKKSEEDEEAVDEIPRRVYDETEDARIKSEFIEQGLLSTDVDLNVEGNENNQEQRKNLEEEGVGEISRRKYNETEEEPIKCKFIDHDLDPEEQASVSDVGDTAVVQVLSVEKIMECVNYQHKNELNVVEQLNRVPTEHEDAVGKSQMEDDGLFIQLASTCEGRDPVNDGLKLEVEMTENATLLQEKEVIEVDNEETRQETVGKEKDGYHEEISACEQFTGTNIAEEVYDKEMKETLEQIEVIDRNEEIECKLLETAQMENAEICKKVSEPCRMFEDEDNNLAVTMKLQQSKEQKATSDEAPNIDLRQLDDTVHDRNASQQREVVTKQDVEGDITRIETKTGNQMETVETTSKFKAEVAIVDVKKSAERETSFHVQPIDREEVAVQEIMGQCFLQQGSWLEESADKRRINELSLPEAPFTEITSVPLKQLDETAVESVDELQSSSLQELDEFSSEAERKVEAKSSSPEQTAEVSETLSEVAGTSRGELKCERAQPECEISPVENTCDKSILDETPLDNEINQDVCTVRDSAAEASSHRLQIGLSEALYLPERDSEQETLEMQRDSQKDTEQQEQSDEAETGLLDEIKDVTSCLGVVEEIMSGLTKESEESERELLREIEAPERKEHKSELESHEETSESNVNEELLNDAWERDKELVGEITDIETVVVSTGEEMESVKKMEEPITEEEMDTCHLVFSESDASKEISKEQGESTVDSKEDVEERGRLGLKRGVEKMAGNNDKDKPSVLKDFLLPPQASSLDFTVQKSKIAVKNPLVRPPKDPRMLINMASVEPLTPPHPSQPSFLKKSPIEGASVPKGVIGFKLPGLAAGFPALRKTEAGRKIRDGEDSESVTSQKSDSGSQSAEDNVKQETSPPKPKWTPPRQPGMGSPLMMAELKSKLKKPAKE